MAQRISRAKQTIKASGGAVPDAGARRVRGRGCASVLHVLYLIFNEGYASSAGADLHRAELSGEAIRLTRAVHRLLPDDREVAGLLALMLLTDARRPARTGAGRRAGPAGRAGPDPVGPGGRSPRASRWSRPRWPRGAVGEYQLQAAIAARARRGGRRAEDTDWPQILGAVRAAGAADRQPDGDAQPGGRRRHGARPGGRAGPAGDPRRAAGRPPPAGRRPRAPARAGRRPGARPGHYRAAASRRPACRSGTTSSPRRPALALPVGPEPTVPDRGPADPMPADPPVEDETAGGSVAGDRGGAME